MTTNHKPSAWTISIAPTRQGIRVRTNSDVGDVLADRLSQYVEQCLLRFAQMEGNHNV
jgi:hypothetical protein